MLPKAEHCPAGFPQTGVGVSVAFAIPLDLFSPPGVVLLWPYTMVRTSVPIATIHEDGDTETWENNIGMPTNGLLGSNINAVAKAQPMNFRSKSQFWVRIPAMRGTHAVSGCYRCRQRTGVRTSHAALPR